MNKQEMQASILAAFAKGKTQNGLVAGNVNVDIKDSGVINVDGTITIGKPFGPFKEEGTFFVTWRPTGIATAATFQKNGEEVKKPVTPQPNGQGGLSSLLPLNIYEQVEVDA